MMQKYIILLSYRSKSPIYPYFCVNFYLETTQTLVKQFEYEGYGTFGESQGHISVI